MRYIILLLSLILCVPLYMSANITTIGCYYFYQNYWLTFMLEVSGGCYITGIIVFLPLLSILLICQVRKIRIESKKLQYNGRQQNLRDIQTYKVHLRQLLIVIYTFIFLIPNIFIFLQLTGILKNSYTYL